MNEMNKGATGVHYRVAPLLVVKEKNIRKNINGYLSFSNEIDLKLLSVII